MPAVNEAFQGEIGPAHERTFIIDAANVPPGDVPSNNKSYRVRALTPEFCCKGIK